MFRVSNFAKYAASAKAALSSRDAASSQQNLETINAAVLKLTEIVDKYEGGLLAASSISNQEAALGQDIKNAITDAKAAETVSEEEAAAIIAYIEGTLEPNIKLCMKALKEKKEKLAAAKLQGTVQGDLKDLRESTNTLGAALVEKAPAAKQDEGKAVNKTIDADFEDAVQYFA